MGRYINYNDINERYPSIAKQHDRGVLENAHIRYAEAQVEAAFANEYTVPFSDNNLTVKDLTLAYVYVRVANLKVIESDKLWNMLHKRIEKIRNGQEFMVTTSGEVIGKVGETVWSNTEDYAPVFGMGGTLDFVVDSDRMLDEEDARL